MSVAGTFGRRVAACVGICLLCGATPRVSSVSGQLVVLDRPGPARSDLTTAVVYLEPVDRRATDDEVGSVNAVSTIAMRGKEFLPRTAVVRRGGQVRFPNQDPFSHNVFSNTDPGSFDLGLYRRGATRSASFAQSGVYEVFCNIHAKMVSYVVAVPTRHVTLAAADGSFSFDDVPVGTYRVHAWHERSGMAAQALDVTGSGASVRLTLDARGYVSGAHLNKFGQPYSSTRTDRY
jgi:plastocyanin